jgi:hypothetical protein
MELLQYIPPEMMGARGYAVMKFVENLDSFSEKDLEELRSIIEKDVELAKMNTEMQLQQMQAQTQNTQAQAQMTGAQSQALQSEMMPQGEQPMNPNEMV